MENNVKKRTDFNDLINHGHFNECYCMYIKFIPYQSTLRDSSSSVVDFLQSRRNVLL